MNNAAERLIAALPYLRNAVNDVLAQGEVAQLAVLSNKPDGSGKIVCRFDCTEFFADLAEVLGVGELTEEDNLKAEAAKFCDRLGIKRGGQDE